MRINRPRSLGSLDVIFQSRLWEENINRFLGVTWEFDCRSWANNGSLSARCHTEKTISPKCKQRGEKKSLLFSPALEPSTVMTLGNWRRQSCVAENPLASLLLDSEATRRNGAFWYSEAGCTGGIRNNCLVFFFFFFSERAWEGWQKLARVSEPWWMTNIWNTAVEPKGVCVCARVWVKAGRGEGEDTRLNSNWGFQESHLSQTPEPWLGKRNSERKASFSFWPEIRTLHHFSL